MKHLRDFEGRWETRKDGTEYWYSASSQYEDYGCLKYHESRDNEDNWRDD